MWIYDWESKVPFTASINVIVVDLTAWIHFGISRHLYCFLPCFTELYLQLGLHASVPPTLHTPPIFLYIVHYLLFFTLISATMSALKSFRAFRSASLVEIPFLRLNTSFQSISEISSPSSPGSCESPLFTILNFTDRHPLHLFFLHGPFIKLQLGIINMVPIMIMNIKMSWSETRIFK